MTQSHPARNQLQTLAALVIGVAALYFVRDLFLPLAFALILTFLLTPVVDSLRKLRLGRVPSAIGALSLSFAVICLFIVVVTGELMDIATSLPNYQQRIHQRLTGMHNVKAFGGIMRGMQILRQELSNGSQALWNQSTHSKEDNGSSPEKQPVPVRVVGRDGNGLTEIRDFVSPLMAPLGMAGVVLVFTAFILIKREDVRNRIVKLAGVSQISATTLALEDAERRVGHYLQFALLINSCFGVLIALGLFLIGVPNVLLWGMIAGIMRFVPYAGILISVSFPLLLSLAIFPGWEKPGLVLVLFFVLELIVANFVEPVVYGANTGTSPLGLLVAAVFWAILWGPLGLVLSTPLTVCLVVLGRHVPQLSFLYVLLAEDPPLKEEVRLYQRLLASDHEEARMIVDQLLEDLSLVELYDRLLIPALRLVKQDRHRGVLNEAQAESVFAGVRKILATVEMENGRVEPTTETGTPVENEVLKFDPSRRCQQIIACVAVLDQADELCAIMLAQVLHQYGYSCIQFPFDRIQESKLDSDDIIFLSALPPFAFVSARSYCARIKRQRPSNLVVVGMWGHSDEPERIRDRFGPAKPDYVVTHLTDALEFVLDARVR